MVLLTELPTVETPNTQDILEYDQNDIYQCTIIDGCYIKNHPCRKNKECCSKNCVDHGIGGICDSATSLRRPLSDWTAPAYIALGTSNDYQHFRCANKKRIPLTWVCDGQDDCGDTSDETRMCTHLPWCSNSSSMCSSKSFNSMRTHFRINAIANAICKPNYCPKETLERLCNQLNAENSSIAGVYIQNSITRNCVVIHRKNSNDHHKSMCTYTVIYPNHTVVQTKYRCQCPCATIGINTKNRFFLDQWCASNPCRNGGYCSSGYNPEEAHGFKCHCAEGYDGVTCSNDIDECASRPCQNNGTCIDQVNGYSCNCADGYDGTNCDNLI